VIVADPNPRSRGERRNLTQRLLDKLEYTCDKLPGSAMFWPAARVVNTDTPQYTRRRALKLGQRAGEFEALAHNAKAGAGGVPAIQ
jgi:hypothetical protein